MNYDELVAVSKAYADRNDIEVDENIDNFIVFVEARMNRTLKTRKQSARAYIATVTDEEYYPLPIDYAGMRDIQLDSTAPTAEHEVAIFNYLQPEAMNKQRVRPYAGRNYYTIIADQLQIYPCQEANQALEIVYFQQVPNLNSENNTNWMSDNHPDMYLAGMTAEIELFVKHFDIGKLWYDRMTSQIQELDSADVKERWGGSALFTRVDNG